MTTTQYQVVAAHIARHCMEHSRFVYDSEFKFEGFTLRIRVTYNARRRRLTIRSDKFRVEQWKITECTAPVHFDPDELLRYLR